MKSFRPDSGIDQILHSKFLSTEHSKHQICIRDAMSKIDKIKSFGDLMCGSGASLKIALQIWPHLEFIWINDYEKTSVRNIQKTILHSIEYSIPHSAIYASWLDFNTEWDDIKYCDYYHIDFNTFSLLKSNIYVWDNLRKLYKNTLWLGITDTACHCWHINYKYYGFPKENINKYYCEIAKLVTGSSDNLFSVNNHKNAAYLILKHS
jgi:hypothetical protein